MPERPSEPSRIGLIVVSHGDLARALVETGELVVGGKTALRVFAFKDGEEPRAILQRLRSQVRKSDQGEGVILIVDLFGGTPGSLALSMIHDPGVEVITGANLPMILTAATLPPGLSLREACRAIFAAGTEAIKEAGAILKG